MSTIVDRNKNGLVPGQLYKVDLPDIGDHYYYGFDTGSLFAHGDVVMYIGPCSTLPTTQTTGSYCKFLFAFNIYGSTEDPPTLYLLAESVPNLGLSIYAG